MSNIYNKFRGVERLANQFSISKRFDEPTYFSFRLLFSDQTDQLYNIASDYANYDVMPHPLFSTRKSYTAGLGASYTVISDTTSYSAVDYLENANEPARALMLREFIERFNELQNNFQYYFQQVDGISDLLKTDSTKGQRLIDKKITVTCLEGIDLRMSYLLNLYRKIVWDDVYQRWVLPDMMRYFTLKIFLAEFRTMQIPSFKEGQKIMGYGDDAMYNKINTLNSDSESTQLKGQAGQIQSSLKSQTQLGTSEVPVYLRVLDNILPTWQITCEMCEIDLSDITFEHLNNLNTKGDLNQGAVKFSIKIGNIKELQTYPVFKNRFLSDVRLNAINRSRVEDTTSEKYTYPATLQVAQNRDAVESAHISGRSWVERTNENNINEANTIKQPPYVPLSAAESDRIQEGIAGSTFDVNFKATIPSTWVGNAMSFGVNYAKNWLNRAIDKAKITSIPQLGVSYEEVKAVLGAKNVVGAFGLIRKGIYTTAQYYDNGPSSRLSEPIQTDAIMRDFLTELSKSRATGDDDSHLLIEAANTVLNDKGLWEKIKDYSLATDLVGPFEVNRPNKIEGADEYAKQAQSQAKLQSNEGKTLDPNTVRVFESTPSSALGARNNIL